MARSVVGKMYCPLNGRFLGLVGSDGRLPLADDCRCGKQEKCREFALMIAAEPALLGPRESCKGGGYAGVDEDSGGYGSIARRALEGK
jgi:hypothetical protein